jgi:hypothetical protein
MKRGVILVAAIAVAGVTLTAAQQPSALADSKAGLWEIEGIPGSTAPARSCFGDVLQLARLEHRGKTCTMKLLDDRRGSAVLEYSCGPAGFGRSEISVITPRSLRIATQGISRSLPFNYVLHAHRVGECAASVAPIRH